MTNNLQKMLWAKINFLLLLHMSHQTASDKYDVDVILESTAISVDFGGHHREIGDLCTQIGDNSGFLSPQCDQWFLYFSISPTVGGCELGGLRSSSPSQGQVH